jgi:hypothetical protein
MANHPSEGFGMKHFSLSTLFSALMLTLASPVMAVTWTSAGITAGTGASYTNSASNTLTVGDSSILSPSSGSVTVKATAWANTNETGTVNETSVGTVAQVANSLSYTLESAYLGSYSGGYGVTNRDMTATGATTGDPTEGAVPEHAMDNQGRYDSVLFSFSGATNGVVLSSVVTGWVGCANSLNGGSCGGTSAATTIDSDISVWAYTGGTNTSTNLTGTTYSSLGSGWTLVGSYDGGTSTGSITINAGNVSSSYWLIGAYVPVTGTCYKSNGTTGGTCDAGDDYLKIASLNGTVATCASNPTAPGCGGGGGHVPEPATLCLLGLGLLGMSRVRRTRKLA